MIAEIYPYLFSTEKELDSPFTLAENNPLWGKGKAAREARINATITQFGRQLKAAGVEEITAYAEGLKPHLKKAMEYKSMTDRDGEYKEVLAYCHRQLSFSFFALILREYDSKKAAINARDYAASAGIEDYPALSSDVIQAADDWGIFHTPTIEQLLAGFNGKDEPRLKEYDLLADYPDATKYLDRLVPDYINEDYSLNKASSNADASVIAYTIAGELNICEVCKYFEKFWSVKGLAGAHKQVRQRKNKAGIRELLRTILRKSIPGVKGDTEDTTKIEMYLHQYQ